MAIMSSGPGQAGAPHPPGPPRSAPCQPAPAVPASPRAARGRIHGSCYFWASGRAEGHVAAAGSSRGCGEPRRQAPRTAPDGVSPRPPARVPLASWHPASSFRPAQPRTRLPRELTPPPAPGSQAAGWREDRCGPRRRGPTTGHCIPLGKGDVHPGSAGSNLKPKRTGQRQSDGRRV